MCRTYLLVCWLHTSYVDAACAPERAAELCLRRSARPKCDAFRMVDSSAKPVELPGSDLVRAGLSDLRAGRDSIPAMLVATAAPRLRSAGVDVPRVAVQRPSHRLYDLLAAEAPDDAHSRYNALVRRIVSFAGAAEHARARHHSNAPTL